MRREQSKTRAILRKKTINNQCSQDTFSFFIPTMQLVNWHLKVLIIMKKEIQNQKVLLNSKLFPGFWACLHLIEKGANDTIYIGVGYFDFSIYSLII